MLDSCGRQIDYMRISVTDRCNLRCRYCMPEGITCIPMSDILTLEELCEAAEAAAVLGIRYIKLTGGEPLVRKGVDSLVRMLKAIPGIEKVTLTTNGILLERELPGLLNAGLDAVNISLDTMNRELFRQITGTDGLDTVLRAIRCACDSGIPVKVNAVSMDLGKENLRELISLAQTMPLDVRFIEMMPIGQGKEFPVVDHRKLIKILKELYPDMQSDSRKHGFGPAVYYQIPGYQGSIGLISAIHGKFCDSCNRIRLTSQGYLKNCLCYEDGTALRGIIRSGLPDTDRKKILVDTMQKTIMKKPGAHCFDDAARITEAENMNAIGG